MPKGIDVRETASTISIRASLKDTNGEIVSTGPTSLKIYEIQTNGTLKTFDFSDSTFKTGACTLASGGLNHQQANNNTINTGIWSTGITNVLGFSTGNIYVAQVYNSNAVSTSQEREFQYGAGQGDMRVSASGGLYLDFNQPISGIGASGNIGTFVRGGIAQAFGKWTQVGTALNIYSPDGSVLLHALTLDSATTPTSRSAT